MTRYKITAEIFVRNPNADPEEIASEMDRGLGYALSNFPQGEIMGARVDRIEEADPEEQRIYFEE